MAARPSPRLSAALDAAHAAGRVLHRRFARPLEVRSKGWRDIVTDADVAAERAIVTLLRRRFPDDAIVSEEGSPAAALRQARPTWIIDPLDGTANYAHGFPVFSVAVGLARRGHLLIGVVHDPLRGETFYAERGRGAFLRAGRRPPSRLRSGGTAGIGQAIFGLDWARDRALRRRLAQATARLAARCRTLRAIGSAALGLAYVAAGRLDGYYHIALQPWDVAAGALIAREAGARLSTPAGTPWRLGDSQAVAGSPQVQAALLKALNL